MARIEVTLRREQHAILKSMKDHRFGVLICHRRMGKTYLALWWLVLEVLKCKRDRPRAYYFCPTFSQAKRVAWDYLKAFTKDIPGVQYNEAELRVDIGGRRIQLGSADNPDASRGIYADAVVMDEPALMTPRMWSEVLVPALADREGKVLFIGTPMGRRGLLYDTYINAEAQGWVSHLYRASETGIIPDTELALMRGAMDAAEYEQELECSFDAAVKGAYWAEAMTRASVASYAHDAAHKVHICLDLGMNDATAAWFFQIDGNKPVFINYAEYTNMGLPDIVKDWRGRPYTYGKIIAPPDIKVRSLSTGTTRLDTLTNLGCDVIVAPKVDVIEGINAARLLIERACFDATLCREGIESLRQYRADWEDKKGVLMLRPRHDSCSHAADSMRYLAVTGIAALQDMWSNDLDYSLMARTKCVQN